MKNFRPGRGGSAAADEEDAGFVAVMAAVVLVGVSPHLRRLRAGAAGAAPFAVVLWMITAGLDELFGERGGRRKQQRNDDEETTDGLHGWTSLSAPGPPYCEMRAGCL